MKQYTKTELANRALDLAGKDTLLSYDTATDPVATDHFCASSLP